MRMDDEDMDARIYRISEYEYAIRNTTEMKYGKESKEHKSNIMMLKISLLINFNKKVRMRLDDEDKENGLQLVPATYGKDVPSACTIVIIAGK